MLPEMAQNRTTRGGTLARRSTVTILEIVPGSCPTGSSGRKGFTVLSMTGAPLTEGNQPHYGMREGSVQLALGPDGVIPLVGSHGNSSSSSSSSTSGGGERQELQQEQEWKAN